ncbi:MAG: SDR family oxidoreductase, partial [Halomonas sp.]
LLTRHFAETVQEGQVINIIDNKVAYHQYPYAAYLLSKKSLAEMTRMAALEFAPRIRINGLAPGVVLPASQRTSDYVQWRIEGIPLKQQGEPAHLVQALYYLLDNTFVAGQILFVDGGESINLEGRHSENYRH